MQIINSTLKDVDDIFRLYEDGTSYQKLVGNKHWKGFKRELIENEIKEKRQWKIIFEDEIVCVFAISFNDPQIWKEKDRDPAIYIHRIATNTFFRGNSFTKHIIAWAITFATEHGKTFIRMDTGSGNEKLNNYYVSCGFTNLGVIQLTDTDGLPQHYKEGSSNLFEIDLSK